MKSKAAQTVGFYFKWLAKSSLGPLFWRLSRAQLRQLIRAHPGNDVPSIKAIADQYKGYGYYKRLHPFQVPREYELLLEFARSIQPKVVVEIGTADGGTLLGWCRLAREVVVSVDQPLNIYNWGYAPVRQRLYRELCADRPELKLHLMFGDSHAESTKKDAQSRLGGRKVDLLFIDGDHSYAGVRRDYDLWKDLVRPGGYIVLHDILLHTRPMVHKSEVDRLWQELKPTEKCSEIVADSKQGWAGIGIVQIPRMIYDAFLFFNELELLELRLHELSKVVDRFIIVEATRTFTGKPKPLHYAENANAFHDFQAQIIHVVVEDLPPSDNPWDLEDFQRNCLARGFAGCRPEDIIMVSDADEIPRAEKVRSAAEAHHFDTHPAAVLWHRLLRNPAVIWTCRKWFKRRHPFVKVFEQRYHPYFLNCVREAAWFGTRLVHYRDFTTATHLRRWKGVLVQNGGWHFSFMGGVARIQDKLGATSHQEYNTPHYNDSERLTQALRDGHNILFPDVPLKVEAINEAYPAYLRNNQARFSHWIRPAK